MFGGDLEELTDRARPCLVVTERIAAGQHHPGHHAVWDAGLSRRRPDDGLVGAKSEVAQRVGVTVACQQRTHAGDVIVGQLRLRLWRPQREVHDSDGREQAHCEQGPGDEVRDPLGGEPQRSVDADQPLHDVRELGGQRMGPEQAPAAYLQQEQTDRDRSGGEDHPDPQRPPPGGRIPFGLELPSSQQQADDEYGGGDRLLVVKALDHVQDDARREQRHHTVPGAALAPAQTSCQEQQEEPDHDRERRSLLRDRSGQDLPDHVETAAPSRRHRGEDVDESRDEHQGGSRGRHPRAVPRRQRRQTRPRGTRQPRGTRGYPRRRRRHRGDRVDAVAVPVDLGFVGLHGTASAADRWHGRWLLSPARPGSGRAWDVIPTVPWSGRGVAGSRTSQAPSGGEDGCSDYPNRSRHACSTWTVC